MNEFAFFLAGWVARDVAMFVFKFDPKILTAGRKFSSDVKKPQETTVFLTPKEDGHTDRLKTNIPLLYWQEVSRTVVAMKAKNLSGPVIERALPNMPQGEQRALRTEMVGYLSEEHVGVLVVKGNAAVITQEGWGFFARVSKGMISPFVRKDIPYTPPDRPSLEKLYSTQHTRATRANLAYG